MNVFGLLQIRKEPCQWCNEPHIIMNGAHWKCGTKAVFDNLGKPTASYRLVRSIECQNLEAAKATK